MLNHSSSSKSLNEQQFTIEVNGEQANEHEQSSPSHKEGMTRNNYFRISPQEHAPGEGQAHSTKITFKGDNRGQISIDHVSSSQAKGVDDNS